MFLKYIKNIQQKSSILNFNVVERDKWIQKQSKFVVKNSCVLDIGAGSSPYRKYFTHCKYVTQDFCQLETKQLRFKNGYSSIDIVSNADNIPLPDESYDIILLTEVLEHVPNPIDVLKEATRILKRNGFIIITAPLGSGLHQQPFHFYGGYTPFWYQKFLKEFDYENIEIIPNGNFFKFFGQEFQRFINYTNPLSFGNNILFKIFWFPFWIFLLPFWILVPLFMNLIDKLDNKKLFTIGYHVIAKKI